jgi:hypothetical protein
MGSSFLYAWVIWRRAVLCRDRHAVGSIVNIAPMTVNGKEQGVPYVGIDGWIVCRFGSHARVRRCRHDVLSTTICICFSSRMRRCFSTLRAHSDARNEYRA